MVVVGPDTSGSSELDTGGSSELDTNGRSGP